MKNQSSFIDHVIERGCLKGEEFYLLDVGASGGIQPHWNAFQPHLKAVGFDPLVTEVERLNRVETNPRVRYEDGFVGSGKPAAAADKIASRNNGSFARTSAVRATSLLNMNYQKDVFNCGAEMVWSKKQLTLDGWLPATARGEVDFIKIDTDGSDFPVLQGAEKILAAGGVLGLSVECPFHGAADEEANLFCNIDRLLRRHGYTLFDLEVYRYSRADLPRPFLYDIPAQTTHGGVQWAEALYFQDLGDADFEKMWRREFSAAKKLKLAGLFDIFDLPDCAVELLKKFRVELEPHIDFTRCLDALTPELMGEKLTYEQYGEVFESFLKQKKLFQFGREKIGAPVPANAIQNVSPASAEASREMARLQAKLGRMLNRSEPLSEIEIESSLTNLNALLGSRDISAELDRLTRDQRPALLPLVLHFIGQARREGNEPLAEVLELIYGRLARRQTTPAQTVSNVATAA